MSEEGLVELQRQLNTYAQQIYAVKSHKQVMERERARADLTGRELASLDESTVAFRTVGKMFVVAPLDTLKKELTEKSQLCEKEISKDNESLKYVEKVYAETEANLKDILAQRK